MDVIAEKSKPLKGSIEIPPDKSITHRAFMFSSLSKGKSKITNYSNGADCMATLDIIKQLGCTCLYTRNNQVIIDSSEALKAPLKPLNCGNSGTTTRLISGILAGQNFTSVLFGDSSLSNRPMKRIIEPLTLMNADIVSNNFKMPLTIKGSKLVGIDYNCPLASAQVKSCILLAGLFAEGTTSFSEPYKSRNHTELMLDSMGADINVYGNKVSIKKSELKPLDINICGDISSAAFFIAAALIIPHSEIIIKNVGINPTRSGIIDVLKSMKANIEIFNERNTANEPVADIKVSYTENLKAVSIQGDIIPRLIDEIPIIALIATQAEGTMVINDAQDLRNKEADRISAVCSELTKLGADISETPDGFVINGKTELTGDAVVDCFHDHRIAMTAYIAGLICKKPIKINEFEWVKISFPEFLDLFYYLT